MNVLSIANAYRRNLPHIDVSERPLFVTYGTFGRWRLPPAARTIALKHVLYAHTRHYFVHVVVVMPDHVHIVMTLPHPLTADARSLAAILKGMKGVSARRINEFFGRRGHVWVVESFDRVVRRTEGLMNVCNYVIENPVRAGLVAAPDDYPWLWRPWLEGRGAT